MELEPEPLERPPAGRFAPLTTAIRPWIDWFGLGRIVTTVATVVLVVVGGWWLLRSPDPSTEAALPMATAEAVSTTTLAPASTSTTAPSELVVHVAGAVSRPGVYELAAGARVHAAIDAAGGPLPEAQTGALNLAAQLVDGERVYVPVAGEPVPVPVPALSPGPSSIPAGPVDLNRATAADLDSLPGVGPATAQAIVEHRVANGPFASVDDLEAVRGIGPAKLEAIRPLVTT